MLKIDRSFVATLDECHNVAIVHAVTNLGHALNAEVLAEGVETAEQLRRARDAGCDLVQGYFVGLPMEARHLAAHLAQCARETAQSSFSIADKSRLPCRP